MKIIECRQYEPEWYEARKGIPTASQFHRIMTKTGKLAAGHTTYLNELIADLICQHPGAMTEKPMNAAMRHGVDCEPQARNWYAFNRGVEVQQVGFITTDDGRFGSSPDFLVDPDGLGELKCAQMSTHIGWLRAGVLPPEHACQCHGHLIVSGRAYCDFLSYCPGAKPLLIRVVPDEFTMKLRTALELFWDEYQAAITKVKGM